jgi:Beta-lactamase enzyme family
MRHPRSACLLVAVSIGFAFPTAAASDFDTAAIGHVLAQSADKFGAILANPEAFRLQILLSEVVENAGGPRLKRYGYRVDAEYFYPASSIKTCAAVTALRVLADTRKEHGPEVNLNTPLRFHPLFDGDGIEDTDPTNLRGGTITVGHEIRKLFLVSDNEAYNRLYELTGHAEINEWMWKAGLESVRLRHRLSIARSSFENLQTPQVDFVLDGGFAVEIPQRESRLRLEANSEPGILVGDGHRSGGATKNTPLSFAEKNRISLVDLQDLHVMILRPDVQLGKPGLPMSDSDRAFLKASMAEYAHESTNPVYDASTHPDDYVRFILHGLMRVTPKEDLIVYDKVGLAYGFTVENAYVVNQRTGKSFFLTATIYTNSDGILNDDRYDYDTVAFPFWKDLGEVLARWRWATTENEK